MTTKIPYRDFKSGEVQKRFEKHEFPSLYEAEISSGYVRIVDTCWNERYHCTQQIKDNLPGLDGLPNAGSLGNVLCSEQIEDNGEDNGEDS